MASLSPHNGFLGKRLAKHLLRRATYRVNKERIDEFSNYTAAQALAKLSIRPTKNLQQPIFYETEKPWIDDDPIYGKALYIDDKNALLRSHVIAWWLDEARRDTSYRSKMTYFLYTNFTATSNLLNGQKGAFYDYLTLLEFFCLGDWKEFAFQITKNNFMLFFLNNTENKVQNPNENYAREFLELFTIGKGPQAGPRDYTNYTEEDVVEAAKVLTGWRMTWSQENRGIYRTGLDFGDIPCGYASPNHHDFNKKQFSHRFDNYVIPAWNTSGKSEAQKKIQMEQELKEFINMVLAQEETAKFICRKMYRYFVSRKITDEIENDIITPLSATFRKNYNLEETFRKLLLSQHFFDEDDSDNKDEIIGGIIKSPLELSLQTFSMTDYPVPDPISEGERHYKYFYKWCVQNNLLSNAGQDPFNPPSVAGFSAHYEAPDFDKFWFNSSSMTTRYKLGNTLLSPWKTGINFSVTNFVKNNVTNPSDPYDLVNELTELLFPESIDAERLQYFVSDILLDNGSLTPEMWQDEWMTYLNTQNQNNVEDSLRDLFRALTWSQEYQTM